MDELSVRCKLAAVVALAVVVVWGAGAVRCRLVLGVWPWEVER